MKAMNGRRLQKYGKLSFGLATFVLLFVETAVAQTTYTVTDLGTVGGTFSVATDPASAGKLSASLKLLLQIRWGKTLAFSEPTLHASRSFGKAA
jgi:hypothetical protein